MTTASFANRLLRWWDTHGRKDLPWQRQVTPYRVWVSEIMLQQTQVTTVIPYFQRFMKRFPSLKQLAQAPLDEVLAHWSGLGYYARGRNLHRAAQQIRNQHQGRFPDHPDALMALPGVGRSTAGAILALAKNQRQAILDGNVKRVLARHSAIGGWPGLPTVEKKLWAKANEVLTTHRFADYTQALMDLGATCCLARAPQCRSCPLRGDCKALAMDQVHLFPGKKLRKELPIRNTVFILARDAKDQVLLEQRPPSGIWGGLWCFPEAPNLEAARSHCQNHLGLRIQEQSTLQEIRHKFSHYQLNITPLLMRVEESGGVVLEGPEQLWYNPTKSSTLGLATPVSRLLKHLTEAHST